MCGEAQWRLGESVVGGMGYEVWRVQVEHYKPLIERVIEQTERRVFAGETVPAREKLVSVFEPHTDIIKKSNRETRYGHKLNLSSGRSGLILDVVVEKAILATVNDTSRCWRATSSAMDVPPDRRRSMEGMRAERISRGRRGWG